jgi:hypothetical protein
MTPESLSNPLASVKSSGVLNSIAGADFGEMLLGNTGNLVAMADVAGIAPGDLSGAISDLVSGDISSIASAENLTSFAVMGAGIYVSSLTGGIVPPKVASAVIENVAGNTINTAISGALSNDPHAVISAASSINPSVNVSDLAKAITTDSTGVMSEGLVGNIINKSIDSVNQVATYAPHANEYQNIAESVLTTINPEGYTGTIGGINYGDASAMTVGITLSALESASDNGNVNLMTELAGTLIDSGLPKDIVSEVVDNAATNIIQTPYGIEQYNNLKESLSDTEITIEGSSLGEYFIMNVSDNEDRSNLIRSFTQRAENNRIFIRESGYINIDLHPSADDTTINLGGYEFTLIEDDEDENLKNRYGNLRCYRHRNDHTNDYDTWAFYDNEIERWGYILGSTELPDNYMWCTVRDFYEIMKYDREDELYHNHIDMHNPVIRAGANLCDTIFGHEVTRKAKTILDIVNDIRRIA